MHIILAGYTGLTGSFVLAQLQGRADVAKIICVGRTPPAENFKTEFIPLDQVKGEVSSPEASAVICCLGTTMAKAGSKEAFEKVDHDLPVALAKWTRQRASKFILMSSIGANAAAGNFYLKTKGRTEVNVRDEFRGPVFVLRPSVLVGPRKEKRLGERIGIAGATVASPFLAGKLAVYKPIKASEVAAAMVHLALNDGMVPRILFYDDIIKYARRSRF